ncbi:MAG: 50S rRNA methyltransferase [Bdellovibrionales bacterium GWB1_55_8]|nr:MAG: 50S rRNA methyltransferase [Bdellovibrionales bacterium GWB1_55_8]
MAYDPKDYYFKKAKTENYAARSVFKLQEIDDRFKILKPGYKILDLGAAPGSWSQYASQKVGPQGRVLGIDLQPIKITLPNALFITADFRELDLERTMTEAGILPPFDVVLSDMAPKTTGIRITDQTRSLDLCMLALAAAERFLRPRGHFVAKLFHGGDFDLFRDELRKRFARVEVLRPKSTRTGSKEVFFIALQYEPMRAKTG